MSWLYSQALVEEYLVDTCLDGEPSAQSNGNPIQQAYCAPNKMTVFSRLSRFGMTFKPLTENLGEELLTLYLEDFHAKTLAQQAKAQELMEKEAECGEKWRGSFTKYDPDSSLWKTHQCSLLGDLDEFLETWPQWGLMRDGECWEQTMLEQTITENEFGYWLTPIATAISGRSQEAMEYRTKQRESKGHNTVQPGNLAEQVMYSGAIPCKDMKKPTYWPTPKCSDSRHAISRHITDPEGMWKGNLGEVVMSTLAPITGRLNPTWVEWLMGWPLGWTDLKPLATDKSHCVQQPHGVS